MTNENSILTLDAEGQVIEQPQGRPFMVCRVSWVGYLRETWAFLLRAVFFGIIAVVISLGIDWLAHKHTSAWLPWLGLVAAVVYTAYSVMMTASVRLYTDENGVWLHMGVFPWEKGTSGVKWCDVGEATFIQGFASWALRSYDVRVSHRFTTGTELRVSNVHCGHRVVEHINGLIQANPRSGSSAMPSIQPVTEEA